jgi:hypothetical protein
MQLGLHCKNLHRLHVILLVWQHTMPTFLCTDNVQKVGAFSTFIFEKPTALFSFSNANKGRNKIYKNEDLKIN